MGFVLSVFRLFVFGQAKNLQGFPLCQLKYGEGTTHHTAPEDSNEWIWFCVVNASLRRRSVEHTPHREYGCVIHVDNLQNTVIASYYHILALE